MTDEELVARLKNLEMRVAELTHRVIALEYERPDQPLREAPVVPERPVAPPPPPIVAPARPAAIDHVPAPAFTSTAAPSPRSSADWEANLGGNWLNRIGAFVLVVGIALLLGYSFRHMGPWGRDAVGLGASLAMLATGVFYERRPRYRNFGRGLIGGGWAALYFTVYAMQALDAARVIGSPVLGAVLLMAVAVGMILHALRYRAEAVAGLAYFSAFAALALTEVTSVSVLAVVPLAASLLYVARRFRWSKLALFGLIATYAVCAARGNPDSPLWPAQALFAVYWLLFEAFEILVPGTWLMPLNAIGFLSLSILKWHAADPGHLWAFLAGAAAAYAIGGVVRARRHPAAEPFSGGWHGPATATAGLAAAAIFQGLHHQWVPAALLAEGELFFLCGLRLNARYLRLLAIPLFTLEVLYLGVHEAAVRPLAEWVPVAALTVAAFYANRVLRAADTFYGYAAAAVAALIGGYEAPARECGRVWFILAAGPFLTGWWCGLRDFRFQGYSLACLAVVGSIVTAPHPPLSTAIGTALAYVLAACALWSEERRFGTLERTWLFNAASTGGAVALAILLHALLPRAWWGAAWAGETLLLAWGSVTLKRAALRWQGAAAGFIALIAGLDASFNPLVTVIAPAFAIAYLYAAQLVSPRGDAFRLYYSLLGTALTTALLDARISNSALTVAWGIQGLVLLASGFPLRDRPLRLSGLALLLFCILKLFIYDLNSLDTLPRIVSFIVLGLILVGVSWIYTRFRERVQRYL